MEVREKTEKTGFKQKAVEMIATCSAITDTIGETETQAIFSYGIVPEDAGGPKCCISVEEAVSGISESNPFYKKQILVVTIWCCRDYIDDNGVNRMDMIEEELDLLFNRFQSVGRGDMKLISTWEEPAGSVYNKRVMRFQSMEPLRGQGA